MMEGTQVRSVHLTLASLWFNCHEDCIQLWAQIGNSPSGTVIYVPCVTLVPGYDTFRCAHLCEQLR